MSGYGEIRIPFVSVEDAIARRGEDDGLAFYDDLVAARPNATATELAKFVLGSLGITESQQKLNGVRTRYGNDVQAIAARVREARKRAAGPSSRRVSGGNVHDAQEWAVEVGRIVSRDPAYLVALMQVLRQSGHLEK